MIIILTKENWQETEWIVPCKVFSQIKVFISYNKTNTKSCIFILHINCNVGY